MSALALLATSPPLLGAALAVSAPAPAPAQEPPLLPIAWSLAEVAAPPAGAETPPPAEADTAPPAEAQTPPPADPGKPADAPVDEIVVEARYGPPDPAEKVNEVSYKAAAVLDEAVIEPLAYGYREVLPSPIRDGLGNVVRNLGEPSNALNFLLQGKIGKAFETLGRLAINSTLGIGGLIDIAAKPGIGIPYRKNGFANTMGYYGIGPGPYLFVPITGPTTVRDQIGVTLDQALLPLVVGEPFNRPSYALFYFAVNGLDSRLRDDPELAAIKASPDPYRARRDSYLAKRRREIAALKGEPLPEPYVIPGSIPLPAPAAPGTQPAPGASPSEPPAGGNPSIEGLTRGPGAGDKGR